MFGVLLTDLLKASDSLSREVLTAKLNACELETFSVHLIFDYLSNRNTKLELAVNIACGKNFFSEFLKNQF